jgi:hypothetical protein
MRERKRNAAVADAVLEDGPSACGDARVVRNIVRLTPIRVVVVRGVFVMRARPGFELEVWFLAPVASAARFRWIAGLFPPAFRAQYRPVRFMWSIQS